MDRTLQEKQIACLEALEGGVPINVILARYPDDAAALRPFLEAASSLHEMRIGHSLAAQSRSREAFLAEAASMREDAPRFVPPLLLLRRAWATMAGFAMLAVILVAVLGATSTRAVPGDLLYPLKLTLEDIRLSLESDPAARQALQNEFATRRAEEQNLSPTRESHTTSTAPPPTEAPTTQGTSSSSPLPSTLGTPTGTPTSTPTGTPTSTPTSTPTHSVTPPLPSSTLTPTADRTPTPVPSPTTEPEPSDVPGETETPEPTNEPEETETPEPTDELGETETPEPTDELGETETPEPTDEPEETETPESTDEPGETETPEPTEGPGETETPEP